MLRVTRSSVPARTCSMRLRLRHTRLNKLDAGESELYHAAPVQQPAPRCRPTDVQQLHLKPAAGTTSDTSLHLSISLSSVSLSLRLSVSVSLSLCLSVSMSLCLSVSLPLCLSVSLPLCLSVSLSLCLSNYLSRCLPTYPPTHPPT